MKSVWMKHARLWFLLALIAPLATQAIVIKPGVPDAKYLVPPQAFPALVDLLGEGQGVLIGKRWVVTAAHATRMMRMMPKQDHEVIIDGKRREVAAIFVYPGFSQQYQALRKMSEHPTAENKAVLMKELSAMHDIALIKLANPVEEVKPVGLYTGSDEQGKLVEIFGKGATGNGRVGEYPHSPHRGQLRRAYNRITRAHGQWLDYRFDCSVQAPPLEGVMGDGDSGGPVLIKSNGQWLLAGLTDWKHWPKGSSKFHAGVCGQVFSNSRISYYAAWIEKTMEKNSTIK